MSCQSMCLYFLDGEVEQAECPDGHEHNDWVNLDLVVNFSVDQVFDMLFSDNPFFRTFLESINTSGI